MRNVIVGLLILIAGSQANAMSMRRYLTAELTSFRFQQGSTLANRSINGGNVQIDFMERTITLNLQPAFHCPRGAMCAMVMPQPIEISLPALEITTGHCQQRIFKAHRNLALVDGLNETLTVIDNSTNVCRYLVAIPAVEVRLHQTGGHGGLNSRHVIYGKSLN